MVVEVMVRYWLLGLDLVSVLGSGSGEKLLSCDRSGDRTWIGGGVTLGSGLGLDI